MQGLNQNVGYTVITEKMLGSWLPKCNNVYDIIYHRGSLLNILCVLGLLRRESKNCSQYLHISEHIVSYVNRDAIILSLYIWTL